jgi:hypothetical protein
MVAVHTRTYLYIARHDHLVDLASEVRQVVPPSVHMHKHSLVRGGWFDVDDDVLSCIPNMADIVVVGGGRREVLSLEEGCSFVLLHGAELCCQVAEIPALCVTTEQPWLSLVVLIFGSSILEFRPST